MIKETREQAQTRRAVTAQIRKLLGVHGEAVVCRAFSAAVWARREALLELGSDIDLANAAICEEAGNIFDRLTREFDVFV